MFILFKLTAKRMFLITAAAIAAVLVVDAVRSLNDEQAVLCTDDRQRVAYLKTQGITADPEPLWIKETVIDREGEHGWAEYAERLAEHGFDLTAHYGDSVTVYCYAVKSGAKEDSVRMVCDGSRLIGFETNSSTKSV